MKTQNKIYVLFSLILFGFIFLILTLHIYSNQKQNDIKYSHNINTVRALTSPTSNLITRDFPVINESALNISLNEIHSKALITDINNTVLYNNTSMDDIDIIHELYLDYSYSNENEGFVKASFPITVDDRVVGFIIYEIPQVEFLDEDYTTFTVFLVLETIVIGLLIIWIVVEYRKTIIKPLKQLDVALLDISNGIYNTLKTEKGITTRSFTNYNIMLEQLENMLLNQSDYAKSRKQLIANISHEIRTPLSYVKMSAELLDKDNRIHPENKKYVNTILEKITLIDRIIEDLFRFSRQDLDKLLIELKETYAKDMFEKIFSKLQKKDETKKIDFRILNQVPNIIINADYKRIEQVVCNMVDNAEKHIAKEGFISLKTEIDENHLVLTIEDSGEGIETKDLPYIFEPFYQGKQDEKTKRKGAGLGLSICDYIIKKHNGEIFVYSQKDKGTKFVIKFPELK